MLLLRACSISCLCIPIHSACLSFVARAAGKSKRGDRISDKTSLASLYNNVPIVSHSSADTNRRLAYTPCAMAAETMDTPSESNTTSQIVEQELPPPDDIPTPPASCAHKYRIDVVERLVRADFSSNKRYE